MILLLSLGIDAPSPDDAPIDTTEPGDDWPVVVKLAMVGIVVGVVVAWWRFSRGQPRDEIGYNKLQA
ncbi:hypothetical protein VTJ04DRAFT_2766 [Mycothermus thermophilus]|uniref:uncharacterized protein n=1 Tax=Humicola insolens TaxID=85995 RepID=UPI00374397F6